MRLNTLTLLPLAAAHPWAKRAEPAPLVTSENIDESDIIADQYIVKFKDDASIAAAVDGAVSILSVTPDHVYSDAISGFAATLDKDTLEALREHPDVEYIEKNVIVRSNAYVTQDDVPWGLARISHRALGSTSYTYDDSAGEGTCSYIVDTGIDVSHPVSLLTSLYTLTVPNPSQDFEGRATWLENFIDDDDTDSTGHATHVAGTIGSKTYGVAKKTSLYSVKVLGVGGSGTLASLIAGVDFVISDSAARDCPNGRFINLSLGFSGSVSAANDAVNKAVAADIFTGVAAGNSGGDVYWYSPGNADDVCTVGATNSTDARPTWSNYGAKVEIFAPGQEVLSTVPGGLTVS